MELCTVLVLVISNCILQVILTIINSNPERQRDKQRDLSNKLLYLNMFDHLSSKRERERKLVSRLILTLYIGDRNDPDNLLFNTCTMGCVLAFLSVIYTLHFHSFNTSTPTCTLVTHCQKVSFLWPLTNHSIIAHSSLNHHSIITQSSLNHHSIITQSSLNHRSIITHSSLNHHSIITQSSLNHHSLITQSSLNHRSIITQSSLNHLSIIIHTPIIHETLNNEHSIIWWRSTVLTRLGEEEGKGNQST